MPFCPCVRHFACRSVMPHPDPCLRVREQSVSSHTPEGLVVPPASYLPMRSGSSNTSLAGSTREGAWSDAQHFFQPCLDRASGPQTFGSTTRRHTVGSLE